MAEVTAVSIAILGNSFGIILPFILLPEPHRLVSPMLYSILIWMFYVVALIVGVPCSLITMRYRRSFGWVTLLACVLMMPISFAAVRAAGFVLGIPVSFW